MSNFIIIALLLGLLLVALSFGVALFVAQRKIKKSSEEIKKADIAKTDFLSSMSHDIRTPMNAIIGITMIAERHINDPKHVAECLSKIKLASNHLLTLINDVLDISKIESGKLALNPTIFSLAKSVENLVNITFAQMREKNIKFSVSAKDIISEKFFADEIRMNQIFINLLSNAINYTPSGRKINVSFCQRPVPGDENKILLVFKVTDTGIGISPEFQKTMYDSFTRAVDTRVDKIPGSGLGLSIVKHMTDLMGGTIDCQSELNVGTTFTVIIPFTKVEASDEKFSFTMPETLFDLPEKPIKILLLSNDDDFISDSKEILSDLGIECDIAKNISGAVNSASRNNGEDYEIIMIDSNQSTINTLEAVKKLRENPNEKLKIALTSYQETELEEKAKIAGADCFIARPFFKSSLYKKISDILGLGIKENVGAEDEFEELEGMKILVAEDNDMNWEITSEILDMYGIKTFRAENGKECLDMIENSKEGDYDAILMDVQMPVMNGKDASMAIRNLEKEYARSIPIIAATADAFAEDIQSCIEAGMNGHVSKPINFDKLREMLREVRIRYK